mgnify:CR=1 FL=1
MKIVERRKNLNENIGGNLSTCSWLANLTCDMMSTCGCTCFTLNLNCGSTMLINCCLMGFSVDEHGMKMEFSLNNVDKYIIVQGFRD